MLVATDSLKAPELRIGTLGENITLPRTVRAASLVAAGVGGFAGMVLSTIVLGMSIQTLSYGAILGGLVGTGLISYSPLKGESLGRWVLLKLKARRQRTTRDGRPVRLAVGICYVEPAFSGKVHIAAGAANVRSGSVDERFVPAVAARKQLSAEHRLGLRSLPPDDDTTPAPALEPGTESRLSSYREHTADDLAVEPEASALADFRAAQLDELAAGPVHDLDPERTAVRNDRRRHGRWVQDPNLLNSMYNNATPTPDHDAGRG